MRKGRLLKEKRGSEAICERIGNKLFVTSRFSKKRSTQSKVQGTGHREEHRLLYESREGHMPKEEISMIIHAGSEIEIVYSSFSLNFCSRTTDMQSSVVCHSAL